MQSSYVPILMLHFLFTCRCFLSRFLVQTGIGDVYRPESFNNGFWSPGGKPVVVGWCLLLSYSYHKDHLCLPLMLSCSNVKGVCMLPFQSCLLILYFEQFQQQQKVQISHGMASSCLSKAFFRKACLAFLLSYRAQGL